MGLTVDLMIATPGRFLEYIVVPPPFGNREHAVLEKRLGMAFVGNPAKAILY